MGKSISLIYAASENHIIGRDGGIPWRMPADFKHFKQITKGHPVIMGRKTFESREIQRRPLPDRQNIVVTSDIQYHALGITLAHSLQDAIDKAEGQDVFVIGGARLLQEALPLADRVFKTLIHTTVEGDVSFDPDLSHWLEDEHEDHPADERNPYSYTFLTYVRP